MNFNRKYFISILSLLSFYFSFSNTAFTGMRNISSQDFVTDMGAGLNWGNTLDADGPVPTWWGNPITTKPMINAIAKRGFKTFRLPITWHNHIGPGPNFIIEPAWLDTIENIANYAFDNNMYVIINIHHDDSWVVPTNAKKEAVKDQLNKVWTQIANRFKTYGDYLIFETLNEPRLVGTPYEWTGGTPESRNAVNEYNKASLDAIRATGGNNKTRKIMIPSYAASTIPMVIDDLVVPNNDINTIISLHSYFPFDFSLGTRPNWGSDADKIALDAELDKIYNKFVSKGFAVVMGEFTETNNNNLKDRVRHADYYSRGCINRGMCPIYWDIGNSAPDGGLFNRLKLEWGYPEIADVVVNAAKQITCTKSTLIGAAKINTIAQTNPLALFVEAGSDVVLSVSSIDKGAIKWLLPKGNLISNAEISLPKITQTQSGNYEAIFTNKKGCDTKIYFNINVIRNSKNKRYEAENWLQQSGIKKETTQDIDGGENIGYIENNDWSSYTVTTNKAGTYSIIARVATGGPGGDMEMSVNSTPLGTIPVSNSLSSNWQHWYSTTPVLINLKKGVNELVFTYKGNTTESLLNFNWFELTFQDNTSLGFENDTIRFKNSHLFSYPNPTHGKLNLNTESNWQLLSLLGEKLMEGKGKVVDLSHLLNGIYLLKLNNHSISRIVKN